MFVWCVFMALPVGWRAVSATHIGIGSFPAVQVPQDGWLGFKTFNTCKLPRFTEPNQISSYACRGSITSEPGQNICSSETHEAGTLATSCKTSPQLQQKLVTFQKPVHIPGLKIRIPRS